MSVGRITGRVNFLMDENQKIFITLMGKAIKKYLKNFKEPSEIGTK